MGKTKGILERLADGPVVGDGSMCVILEKRGYARAGFWTPEAVLEYPEAVLQLHREYSRAGADVVQTASFKSSDDRLVLSCGNKTHKAADLNNAAYKLARQVADEFDSLVCGGLSPSLTYEKSKNKSEARVEFRKQVKTFQDKDVDFVMGEFFNDIVEVELCVEEMKTLNKPIAVSMTIGLMGDRNGVSLEESTKRMAKTGADIIGTNCSFDIDTQLKILEQMKDTLDDEGYHPFLMCQPPGYLCPEAEDNINGFYCLPEHPFALESRMVNRIEMHKFSRAAWELGVRYIGGCCGVEPHLIRAIAHELMPERKRAPPVQDMSIAFDNSEHYKRTSPGGKDDSIPSDKEYWYNLKCASGRPYNPALSVPNRKYDVI